MENVGCKVIVSGIVQCVGFRYFTCIEAKQNGLKGHAKNLGSGDVEVLMYGSKKSVDKLLKWLENGPRTAQVDGLEINDLPYKDENDFISL